MDDHVARRKRIFGPGMLMSVQWYTRWGLYVLSYIKRKGYFCGTVMCVVFQRIRREHTGNGRLLSRCKIFAAAFWHRHGRVSAYLTRRWRARRKYRVSGGAGGQYIWNRFTLPC